MRTPRALIVLLASLALPSAASAHIGLQPQTVDLQHPPGADLPLDLESLFGYFVSDDGLEWRFTCHEALLGDPQTPGTLLPRYMRTGDGTILVTLSTTSIGFVPDESVYRSTDGGCDWAAVSGLTGRSITSTAVLADGVTVLAASGDIGGDNGLFVSSDAGATFAPSDTGGLPGYFVNIVAGAGPTAWAALADAVAGTATLYRTDDAGSTWSAVPFLPLIEGEAPTDFRVLAVDPADGDHVHVTSAGQSFDYVHRTTDGGGAWEEVHQDPSTVRDASWSGSELVAAVASLRPIVGDGASFATATELPFAEGLTRTSSSLYLATNALIEDFAVVRVDDAGVVPLLGFEEVTSELVCPAGTRHAAICSPLWPGAEVVLGLFGGDDDDDTAAAADDDDSDDDDCDCAASHAADAGDPGPWLLGFTALGVLIRRRR